MQSVEFMCKSPLQIVTDLFKSPPDLQFARYNPKCVQSEIQEIAGTRTQIYYTDQPLSNPVYPKHGTGMCFYWL